MAAPPTHPDAGVERDRNPNARTPRPTKLVGLIVILLLLALFVILHLAGGGLRSLHQ